MNLKINLNNRKQWIDALRGMAMIFVVFGHQAPFCDLFFLYTTPIKIPLFFAITGYVFNSRGGNQTEFFKTWFLKLVFPYFCLVAIPSFLFSFFYDSSYFLDSMRKMISGESFWFMPCLIIAEVIWFYIRMFGSKQWQVVALAVFVSFVGFILARHGILTYGYVNTAMICQIYLLIGYLFRMNEECLSRVKIHWICGILALYVISCYCSSVLFESTAFDIHLNKYFNILYCILQIAIGCLGLMLLAKKLDKMPKGLVYIGQNTFVLYLWAGYALLFFIALSKLGYTMPTGLLQSIIYTVWATLVCCGASFIINRFLPEIVGKKRLKKP